MIRQSFILLSGLTILGCGAAQSAEPTTPPRQDTTAEVAVQRPHEDPPASSPARDIQFPPIVRTQTRSGLEVNAVRKEGLPVAYIRLVIRSGSVDDPANLPGLSKIVAAMLKEGTRTRTSAALAEEIEFLGADMDIDGDEETVVIRFRTLADKLDKAFDLVADIATSPAFSDEELRKLKTRETARIDLQEQDPNFLARRTFAQAVFGDHPYSRTDTTKDALARMRRTDLANWHRAHFTPANAFLVVVGDVAPEVVQAQAERVFSRWRGRAPRAPRYAEPPVLSSRRVWLVDRPESVQSMILIGHQGIARNSEDYVPLMVANQVLGGNAASRLFMDLRERQSLTYGAYSVVDASLQTGSFVAYAAVRNPVTGQALAGFIGHLTRIADEAVPAEELGAAERYLSDSFPLRIDTPAKIADLVVDLRLNGLADDYWDSYRTQIRSVSAEQALAAAQRYIHADPSVVVVVGRASEVLDALTEIGPVTILDAHGAVQRTVEQTAPRAAPQEE